MYIKKKMIMLKICGIKSLNFKTIYVKEYDEWFEITVGTDESEKNTKKLATAKSLCEAELGQVILHDIEPASHFSFTLILLCHHFLYCYSWDLECPKMY